MGMNIMDSCLVTEEIAYGCTGILLAIEGTSLGVSHLVITTLKIEPKLIGFVHSIANSRSHRWNHRTEEEIPWPLG